MVSFQVLSSGSISLKSVARESASDRSSFSVSNACEKENIMYSRKLILRNTQEHIEQKIFCD